MPAEGKGGLPPPGTGLMLASLFENAETPEVSADFGTLAGRQGGSKIMILAKNQHEMEKKSIRERFLKTHEHFIKHDGKQ